MVVQAKKRGNGAALWACGLLSPPPGASDADVGSLREPHCADGWPHAVLTACLPELKEAQRRKKQLEQRCRMEERIGDAVLAWNNEILPNWDTM
ncbi:TBC1 domain family member 14 [Galemys pyrenaicus]|uniref:TBC1 domain family member 14 n=1 Tax=Galemys pyrenaicus TaxID=202257 RepID=A0A8J6AC77_GALPY|nr:TBC1 domain family member 14 [Galemys pyrenaicus]